LEQKMARDRAYQTYEVAVEEMEEVPENSIHDKRGTLIGVASG